MQHIRLIYFMPQPNVSLFLQQHFYEGLLWTHIHKNNITRNEHSPKSGPETRDLGPWDPGPWDPGPWDPTRWDLTPRTLGPGTLELKPPDLGPAIMNSKILRPRPWEMHPESSNWAPPQIILALIVKQFWW